MGMEQGDPVWFRGGEAALLRERRGGTLAAGNAVRTDRSAVHSPSGEAAEQRHPLLAFGLR